MSPVSVPCTDEGAEALVLPEGAYLKVGPQVCLLVAIRYQRNPLWEGGTWAWAVR